MKHALIAVVALACTPAWKQTPHDRLFQIDRAALHEPPPPREQSGDWWEHGNDGVVRPLARLVSPARYAGVIVGGRRAYDTNAFGQVPDSGWFENRIGKRTFTAGEAAAGSTTSGPAEGPLTIVNGKVAGASAGFVVRDSAGVRWHVKFDPPAHPDMSTSAEVISSRLLWLAGYHVPDTFAVDIRVDRFVLAAGATTRDKYNRKVPLTRAGLDGLFALLNMDKAGAVRGLFSREPAGVLLGSFAYRSTERNDPLDELPHEHRRSLRGLKVFYAWINNTDARASNTLDVFRRVGSERRGYVVHYLLDFGDAFGAAGTREKAASQGWRNLADWSEMAFDLVSLGMRYPRWMGMRRSPFRSVGLFEAKLFDYRSWKPDLPNPAFDEITAEDELWAASILARIQPAHVEAAVSAGRYREPGAADYVARILLERRSVILRRVFRTAVALDRPRILSDGATLELDDLRALGGVGNEVPLRYEIRWNRTRRRDVLLDRGTSPTTRIDLRKALVEMTTLPSSADDPFLSVHIGPTNDRRTIQVHLRITPTGVIPVALER